MKRKIRRMVAVIEEIDCEAKHCGRCQFIHMLSGFDCRAFPRTPQVEPIRSEECLAADVTAAEEAKAGFFKALNEIFSKPGK